MLCTLTAILWKFLFFDGEDVFCNPSMFSEQFQIQKINKRFVNINLLMIYKFLHDFTYLEDTGNELRLSLRDFALIWLILNIKVI